MDDAIVRLHTVIEGQVQGVGFRYYAQDKAALLQLTGWVRNTYDGNVEVTAEGPRTALEDFCKYLERGPRGAYVTVV